MDLLSQIVARAKSNKQRIVLPEAEEERTLLRKRDLLTLVRQLLSTLRTMTRARSWLRSWLKSASQRV